eukprot:MONOS_2696.1-p1 / transcript=MONOS_2696.1 / gene=MONOS_2696 / organism=Monocercomonoides_exilis_PA203 / gene_product=unspecified product / transcript_product=unspecified product / location=Mono_scaffold00057:4388-5489(+) / protein_length=317 / sequence_SO=supercontig / SO=protein_coding / is_pseudo=false
MPTLERMNTFPTRIVFVDLSHNQLTPKALPLIAHFTRTINLSLKGNPLHPDYSSTASLTSSRMLPTETHASSSSLSKSTMPALSTARVSPEYLSFEIQLVKLFPYLRILDNAKVERKEILAEGISNEKSEEPFADNQKGKSKKKIQSERDDSEGLTKMNERSKKCHSRNEASEKESKDLRGLHVNKSNERVSKEMQVNKQRKIDVPQDGHVKEKLFKEKPAMDLSVFVTEASKKKAQQKESEPVIEDYGKKIIESMESDDAKPSKSQRIHSLNSQDPTVSVFSKPSKSQNSKLVVMNALTADPLLKALSNTKKSAW